MIPKSYKYRICIIVIVLSLIFPMVRLYYALVPNDFIYFSESLSRLGENLKTSLSKQKIKGYIRSVEFIGGSEDNEIEKLKYDINLILGTYKRWKVIVSEEVKKELENRKARDLAEKRKLIAAGLLNAETYLNFRVRSKKIMVEYNALAHWDWIPGSKKHCRIFLTIPNPSGGNIFNSEIVFTYPPIISSYMAKMVIIKFWTLVSIVTLSITSLYLLIIVFTLNIKKRNTAKTLPAAKDKIMQLHDCGYFSACDKELQRLLVILPNDCDLIALEQRLRDSTKGNPEKAGKAHVELNKLKEYLVEPITAIDEEWYTELKELSQYYNPLRIAISRYEVFLEYKTKEEKVKKDKEKRIAEINSRVIEYNRLLKDGYPAKAKNVLEELDSKCMGWRDIIDFETLQIGHDHIIVESRERYDNAQALIKQGRIQDAEKELRDIISKDKEFRDAEILLKRISKERDIVGYRLIPKKVGKEIFIFKKDSIGFARADKIIPDISVNHKSVSRDNHLKISYVNNEFIAQDMNSGNGTFHRGEKIKDYVLISDGDIVNIAGVYQMILHISKGKEQAQMTINNKSMPSEITEQIHVSGEKENIGGLYIETSDKDIIMVIEYVNIKFVNIGIKYDKSGDCQFIVADDVLLIKTGNDHSVVSTGNTIEYNGINYHISCVK